MIDQKPWREIAIRVLILTEVAALLALANFVAGSWLISRSREDHLLIGRLAFWPVGSFACNNYFNGVPLSAEEWESLPRCLAAVTWAKQAAIILIIDLLCGMRASKWLLLRRGAIFVAGLCPVGVTLLLELTLWLHGYGPSTGMAPGLALLNAAGIMALSRRPWTRTRRAFWAIPLWVAWIWGWNDLRKYAFMPSPEFDMVLPFVPLLGFILYVVSLEAVPGRATGERGTA